MKSTKVKKGKGKKKDDASVEEKRRKVAQERAAKREADEEERQRQWEEAWERKLKCQEELDDIRCCMANGLCLKPKTQSNIWINVAIDKHRQDVQLAFKHVPVPKPKPPPLPRLRRDSTSLMSDEYHVRQTDTFKRRSAKSKYGEGRSGKGKRTDKSDEDKKYIPYRERFKCPID